jgi:hypothetical protein
MTAVQIIETRPANMRSVPLVADHESSHYPEFSAFFVKTFGLAADPFRPPGVLRVGDRHYELVFVGRSGRAFPVGVELNALMPGLEPLDEEVADRDVWAILKWLVDGVGGDWSSSALETTGKIYRVPAAGPAT